MYHDVKLAIVFCYIDISKSFWILEDLSYITAERSGRYSNISGLSKTRRKCRLIGGAGERSACDGQFFEFVFVCSVIYSRLCDSVSVFTFEYRRARNVDDEASHIVGS